VIDNPLIVFAPIVAQDFSLAAAVSTWSCERDLVLRKRGRDMRVRTIAFAFLVCSAASGATAAAKPTQFWNLVSSTVTKLEISKADANAFGPNQTANDPDGAVDHDERLRITGVTTGQYDLRLTLKDGRTCLVRHVDIREGKVFSLEDKDLVDCAEP
jgi:hypothetical protein